MTISKGLLGKSGTVTNGIRISILRLRRDEVLHGSRIFADLVWPVVVRRVLSAAALAARQRLLDAAYALHRERFVRQPPQPLVLPTEVWINPPADQPEPRILQLPRDNHLVPQVSQTG
jgi:hypothetical protein